MKPGMKKRKRAQYEPCSVVIRKRISDQWRGSGVSRGRNPPCFWRQEFDFKNIRAASPGNYIAQWACMAFGLHYYNSINDNGS